MAKVMLRPVGTSVEEAAAAQDYDTNRARMGELDGLLGERRRALIELVLRNQGITFTVYGDEQGTERTFPFDPVPRLITALEWRRLAAGLAQRVVPSVVSV